MRVRLTVARHELPTAKVLWNVSPEATTISKLLEQVHEAIPLESEVWGIEDYAVEINGYEALHYVDPNQLLQQDDEVSVRALKTIDIRERTFSGRYQISASGVHLIDGVAFGKTQLHGSSRPPVHIPPRKRPRLTDEFEDDEIHDDDEAEDDGTVVARQPKRLRFTSTFHNADEDEVDHGDEEDELTGSILTNGYASTGTLRSGKRRKSVSFDESSLSATHDDDEDDEDEDEEDFEPDESEDSDEDGSSSEVETQELDVDLQQQNELQVPSQLPSLGGHPTIPPVKRVRSSASPMSEDDSSSSISSSSSSEGDGDSSSLDSDSDESDSSASEPEEISTKAAGAISKSSQLPVTSSDNSTTPSQTPQAQGPPGQGLQRTKARNGRRRDLKRLQHLKETGQINANMTLAEFKASTQNHSANQPTLEERREMLLKALSEGAVDVTTGGSFENVDDEEVPVEETPVKEGTPAEENLTGEQPSNPTAEPMVVDESLPAEESSSAPVTERKVRSKLDLASSNRLIFGSLGVRNPRNQAEQDRVRAKLAGNSGSKTSTVIKDDTQASASEYQGSGEPRDVDAWKRKIKLSAVECCEEGVVLSAPPFPFKQRWHQQKQSHGKKRKRNSLYQEDEDNTILDYGDAEGHSRSDDDLPALPASMADLQQLVLGLVKTGLIIAFKQLEVSQATNWQPDLSQYKTALIQYFDEDSVTLDLQLAKRDQPQIEYDEKGKRIIGKYEMANEDEDIGLLQLTFDELIEPKILQDSRPESSAADLVTPETMLIPESVQGQFTQDSLFTRSSETEDVAETTRQHMGESKDKSTSETRNTPTLAGRVNRSQARESSADTSAVSTSHIEDSQPDSLQVAPATQYVQSVAYVDLGRHDTPDVGEGTQDAASGLVEASA